MSRGIDMQRLRNTRGPLFVASFLTAAAISAPPTRAQPPNGASSAGLPSVDAGMSCSLTSASSTVVTCLRGIASTKAEIGQLNDKLTLKIITSRQFITERTFLEKILSMQYHILSLLKQRRASGTSGNRAAHPLTYSLARPLMKASLLA